MGFITVHQKRGKKRGDKLQNFRPLKVFHNSNFVNWEFYWEEAITVWVTHISIQLDFLYNSHIFLSSSYFFFTNSFANKCLHFSHIQYQVEFHFFCNLSLNFCNSAQNSWPFQTLLRSTDRKQKSICSQTLVKRKY